MEGDGQGWVRTLVLQTIDAATKVPVVLVCTVLGTAVVLGRALLRPLAGLLSLGADTPAPHHEEGRVRDRALSAKQAARAAGLLGPRSR